MLQTLLLFKCKLSCYHANWLLVSITARSLSASLQIKGLATKYTVKWPIEHHAKKRKTNKLWLIRQSILSNHQVLLLTKKIDCKSMSVNIVWTNSINIHHKLFSLGYICIFLGFICSQTVQLWCNFMLSYVITRMVCLLTTYTFLHFCLLLSRLLSVNFVRKSNLWKLC